MSVIVKEEKSQDIQRIVTITTTEQDVEDFEPTNIAVRSYRKETVDGITTVVTERLDLEGQTYQGQIDGSTSTEPLITHSLFKDLPQDIRNKWSNYQTGRDVGFWKPETETDTIWVQFWARYSGGNDTYFAPRITIRVTGLEDTPPDQTNVGKIDGGWSNVGSVQLPEGVNFLLTAARGNQEGDYWRNTYEWTGCSPHAVEGWDPELYA